MSSKLKRKLFQFVAFFSLFLIVSGALAAEQHQNAKHTLWEVTTDHNTVYLLGSLHLLKSTNYPLADAIEDAFDDSEVVVFELDLDEANNPAIQLAMLNKGSLPEGVTLQETLNAETYALAAKKANELGTDIALLQGFEPWMFALTLASLKLVALGFDSAQGVDRYFFTKARQIGKPVIGLETMEFQINLFDRLSSADQEAIVHQTLLDLDILEQEMDSIVTAWEHGDVAELDDVLLKSFKEYPTIYRKFIVQRNKKWMKKIRPFFKKTDDYMIIVGAGHMVGDEGLVALLKKKGYRVEQR